MAWGKERDAWLNRVSDDVLDRAAADYRVLAEWRRSSVREIRTTMTAEQWIATEHPKLGPEELQDFIDALPRVVRIDEQIPLYDAARIHPSRTAVYNPQTLQGEPSQLLVLCPVTAAMLGWSFDPQSAHIVRDADDREMARTIWWRDGLPQSVDQDERVAEGQLVLLTERGLQQFEAMFGPVVVTTLAWRRIEPAKDDGIRGTRFATDADVIGPVKPAASLDGDEYTLPAKR
ncbi:MAG: hypothetical protein ACLPGW_12485 [Roseiarcus sp.]